MDALWTLPELVAEVATRIAALPAPKNGQVRAIPDDRTVRYYVTLGLLDRPSAMRGRTALYGKKHVAQVVAIKRLQTMGRSLSEIQQLWPTLDDRTLARMSGVELPESVRPLARAEFWKRGPVQSDAAAGGDAMAGAAKLAPEAVAPRASVPGTVELRIELAPHVVLSLSVADESVLISPADVRAIRAAAAPLLAELASRRLAAHSGGEQS
ncbi:MAG TPA: MerR family transcriptional regulator [Kofleriaceae bacterium]